MKITILVVVFYLFGYVSAYKYIKYNLMNQNKNWTKGDRAFSLLLSIPSWFTVITMAVVHSILLIKNDEKADW